MMLRYAILYLYVLIAGFLASPQIPHYTTIIHRLNEIGVVLPTFEMSGVKAEIQKASSEFKSQLDSNQAQKSGSHFRDIVARTPFHFALQSGSPAYSQNFSDPERGCDWMGIGGQVFDKDGEPQPLVVVEAGGDIAGTRISQLGLTGSVPIYGPGGYEITLAQKPIQSSGTLWVQLLSLDGMALTGKRYIDTYADCGKNLVVINFVETREMKHIYMYPLVTVP